MSKNNQQININLYQNYQKARTKLVEIPIWFFRYLSDIELRVVGGILATPRYDNGKYVSYESIAPNKVLAFYANVDSENTISRAKKRLEDKGIITKENFYHNGKQYSYIKVDTNWNKEKYLAEYEAVITNQYDRLIKFESKKEEILSQLEFLTEAIKKGDLSDDKLSDELSKITADIQYTQQKSNYQNCEIPIQDIDKTVDFYINNQKNITNKTAYKINLTKQIKEGTFENIKDVYEKLSHQEMQEIKQNIIKFYKVNHYEITYNNNKYEFVDLKIITKDEYDLFMLKYNSVNSDDSKMFGLARNYFTDNILIDSLTTKNQEIIYRYIEYLKQINNSS